MPGRTNHGRWKEQVQAERRKAAEARQKEYDSLEISEKIRKLDQGGFVATRQRARLLAQTLKANELTSETKGPKNEAPSKKTTPKSGNPNVPKGWRRGTGPDRRDAGLGPKK